MRYSLLLPTAVLAGALALGCGDQQAPTAPAADPPAPSLSVDRSTGPFFSLGFGNEQFSVIIGSTFENWIAFCTTGEQTWDEWTILTVTRPDGSQKNVFKGEDQHLLVWANPADICTESPDYTGTARMVAEDSDVDLRGHGADASGFTVTGTVTDASGQRYHFVAAFRLTVAPEFTSTDNFVIDWRAQKIQLTPIGR